MHVYMIARKIETQKYQPPGAPDMITERIVYERGRVYDVTEDTAKAWKDHKIAVPVGDDGVVTVPGPGKGVRKKVTREHLAKPFYMDRNAQPGGPPQLLDVDAPAEKPTPAASSEPEPAPADLASAFQAIVGEKHTKKDLEDFARSHKLDVNTRAKKEDLRAAIAAELGLGGGDEE